MIDVKYFGIVFEPQVHSNKKTTNDMKIWHISFKKIMFDGLFST